MQKRKPRATKYSLLFLSIALAFFIPPLAGAPLFALRKLSPPRAYWLGVLAAALVGALIQLPGVWVPFATVAVLVGLFVEAEEAGYDLVQSSCLSAVGTLGALSVGMGSWLLYSGLSFTLWSSEIVEDLLAKMKLIQAGIDVEAQAVLQQMPSAIIILLLVTLWMTLMMGPWILRRMEVVLERDFELGELRVPDGFMWIFILSVAGVFLAEPMAEIKIIAVNALNVVALTYFFQGLAVVSVFAKRVRLGVIWQILLIILFATQLFLVLTAVGVVDFWLDFRAKMARKSVQTIGR